ncbi:MAG: YraN family protein [Rectinema sp.]|nr:YraN family protein [Rectinema sp.]
MKLENESRRAIASTVSRGREAEREAMRYLREHGWEIIATNFRSRRGEIDLIASVDTMLVFVEVKSANRITETDLVHVIGPAKRRAIIETSKLFLALHRKYSQHGIRFDLILMRDGTCVRHVEGAFGEHDEAE